MNAKVISWNNFSANNNHGSGVLVPSNESQLHSSLKIKKSNAEYRRLYLSYKKVIVHSLLKKGCSRSEAEEITQESFVRLLSLKEDKFPHYLKTYLYKVAHNLAVDRFRRRSRAPFVDQSMITDFDAIASRDDVAASAEESMQMKESVERIQVALSELPANTKSAFELYKLKGKSYSEISKIMNVSESMVRKHVLRAIRHCYDRLELEI
ncbi:MAG: RNA polymerase sigma factor [Arenicella sp.]|nr:RNA polymerase sigma factor [Arenicella sp.]